MFKVCQNMCVATGFFYGTKKSQLQLLWYVVVPILLPSATQCVFKPGGLTTVVDLVAMANSHTMKVRKDMENTRVKKICAKNKKKSNKVPKKESVRRVPFNPTSQLHPSLLILPLGSMLVL